MCQIQHTCSTVVRPDLNDFFERHEEAVSPIHKNVCSVKVRIFCLHVLNERIHVGKVFKMF
jgi:hypothetical protein